MFIAKCLSMLRGASTYIWIIYKRKPMDYVLLKKR
jgi:hypothetical protein